MFVPKRRSTRATGFKMLPHRLRVVMTAVRTTVKELAQKLYALTVVATWMNFEGRAAVISTSASSFIKRGASAQDHPAYRVAGWTAAR